MADEAPIDPTSAPAEGAETATAEQPAADNVDTGAVTAQDAPAGEDGGGGAASDDGTVKKDGKIFVGGISWETTEEDLKSYFNQHGEVDTVTIMKDKITGKGRGFSFVSFVKPEDAERVIAEKHEIKGRTVDCKLAVPRDQQQPSWKKGEPEAEKVTKIFVGGMSPECTEEEMREYFEKFGKVVECDLKTDMTTQKSRGFGFVTFETHTIVDTVCKQTDHTIKDKAVDVKKAFPKGAGRGGSQSGRGGYGGGRGGGGGYGYGGPGSRGGPDWGPPPRGGYGERAGYGGGHGYGGPPDRGMPYNMTPPAWERNRYGGGYGGGGYGQGGDYSQAWADWSRGSGDYAHGGGYGGGDYYGQGGYGAGGGYGGGYDAYGGGGAADYSGARDRYRPY